MKFFIAKFLRGMATFALTALPFWILNQTYPAAPHFGEPLFPFYAAFVLYVFVAAWLLAIRVNFD